MKEFLAGMGWLFIPGASSYHTGDSGRALENVARLVRRDGSLLLAVYNDQGELSRFWKRVKRFYNVAALREQLHWVVRPEPCSESIRH